MNEPAFALHSRSGSDATTAIAARGQPVDTSMLVTTEQAYRRLLAVQPRHLRTLCGLAMVRHQLGDTDDARTLLGRAADIGVDTSETHLLLGRTFRSLGEFAAAATHFEQALASNPEAPDAWLDLGGCYQTMAQRDAAARAYQQALALNPRLAEAHYNLGNLYAEINSPLAAVVHYERAIAERPGFPEAHNNLGNALQSRGQHSEAVAHYDEAIRLRPSYAVAHRNRGDALRGMMRFDEAIASYRAALTSAPGDTATLNHLATTLSIVGRLDEAAQAYETALAVEPDNVGIQLNYATVRRFVTDDPRLVRLQALAGREDTLSEGERIALHFTLGRAYADIGDGERSFVHLQAGNALERGRIAYDETLALRQIARIRSVVTKELIAARSGRGDPSNAPVFVVGMPRSGTSLIEQILASHPRVHGAGEVNDLAAAVSSFATSRRGEYPEIFGRISDDDLRALAATYLQRFADVAADRIVDKMPANFLFAGLIHLLFPNAKIIHVRRNPVDTCVSCYSLLFAEPQPFAYDLAELGRYYKAYEALMDHWRAVLPGDAMLEVDYEAVVHDVEAEARRIVDHCGLPWDQRCLAFHETKRPVTTASLVQVRQPLFNGSVGRWRLYGDRLKPLMDALGEDARSTSKANTERTFAAAKKLQQRGEHADAEALFSIILAAEPEHLGALIGLGTICSQANRLDESRRCFERAVSIDAASAEALGSLGAVEAAADRRDVAVRHYLKALALAPDHPGILYAYAALLQGLNRNDEAMAALRRAIANRPQHLDALFLLGNLLYADGKDIEAAKCYLAVLNYNPHHAETHNNLGNVLLRQGHPEQAIAQYRKAIASKPDYADAYGNLGNALLELNRLEESIEQNLRALELKPARFGSHNNLGVAYQALGRFDEATAAFERALALSPDEAPIHLNLANMKRFKPGDRRLPALRSLLDRVDQLDQEKEIAAHFAIGKALADLGDHDAAFRHLQAANALKRTTFAYDEAQRLAAMKHVSDRFTPAFFQAHAGHGDPSWSPIFIVGMPRSGTTLLEQVLASHSQVFGAGELETFKNAIGQCASMQKKSQQVVPAYPDLVATLSSEQITELGRTYTAQVRALAPDAPRIVDKMPLNFLFVGLIHLALPNAKIIHIRRDPLDTCVSCFSLLFTGSQPFAYDLGELGRYYRGYEDVMAHWHRVLPPDVMIDVHYEALVEDLEGTSRQVLEHCGLGWEESCRDFQQTRRAVRTASLMQVREPLYRTSLGSWRRYEKFLGPLREALDPESVS